jgi:hypothetical protein
MMRSTYPLVSEALLAELIQDLDCDELGAVNAVKETPDFLRFPNLHDRIEASRDFPGSTPGDRWSDDPWGDDAA